MLSFTQTWLRQWPLYIGYLKSGSKFLDVLKSVLQHWIWLRRLWVEQTNTWCCQGSVRNAVISASPQAVQDRLLSLSIIFHSGTKLVSWQQQKDNIFFTQFNHHCIFSLQYKHTMLIYPTPLPSQQKPLWPCQPRLQDQNPLLLPKKIPAQCIEAQLLYLQGWQLSHQLFKTPATVEASCQK